MHSWLLVLHGWSVLIETSWNVKEERPVLRQSLLHSINRNIVECKEFSFCGSFDCSDGINRNIVECKALIIRHIILGSACINRNIVECKGESKPDTGLMKFSY